MNLRGIGIGLLMVLVCSCLGNDDDDEKKPRTRAEFCLDWAAAACSKEVVSVCQASDVESCRETQADACRALLPDDFSDAMGQSCIDAVEDAYDDADLSGEELATVLRLAGPCDNLIRGSKDHGEDCNTDRDCDGPGGYACVRHADDEVGTCQVPEVVGAGRDCSAAQKTCGVGFYCDGSNCVEAKDAGDDCTIQGECGAAAFCNDDGQCETKHKTDTSCSADLQCAEGICYEYDGESSCVSRIRLGRSEPLCEDLK